MKELRGLDLKRAQLVPSSVFSSPEEVVRHRGLSTAQKLAILRRWEFDARRTAGHAGSEPAMHDLGLLFRVRRALQSLSFRDTSHPALQSDQDGIPLQDDDLLVPARLMAGRNARGEL